MKNKPRLRITLSREHSNLQPQVVEIFRSFDVSFDAGLVRRTYEQLPMQIIIWVAGNIAWDLLKKSLITFFDRFKNSQISLRNNKESVMYSVSPELIINALVVPGRAREFEHIKNFDDLMRHTLLIELDKNSTEEIISNFLRVFSRFEYALKRGGFLKIDFHNNAKADWDNFANDLDRKISLPNLCVGEFNNAVDYFFTQPPKKQIVNQNNQLDWVEYQVSKDPRKFSELLKLVRRVRNNLFHGGKFPEGYIEGSERDETLINCSLVILKKCLEFSPSVYQAYKG